MAIKMNLNVTTSQNLVMTPAMQQAIKILELNQLEMNAYIEEQLLSNPMLTTSLGEGEQDWEQPDGHGTLQEINNQDTMQPTFNDDSPEGEIENGTVADALNGGEFYDSSAHVDSNFENSFDIGYGDRLAHKRPDGAYDEETTSWEERTATSESLHVLLSRQIESNFITPQEKLIAATLLQHLGDSGWLVTPLEDIAAQADIPLPQAQVVLDKMQQFEPSGIFARNLSECLRLQLEQQGLLTPALEILLEHLPLLAEGKHQKLMKLCRCNETLLREMIGDIRRMNPKPATNYDHMIIQHVTPDVFCRKGDDGTWLVELNEQNLPQVLVDRHYYAQAVAGVHNTIDKQYLTEQWQNANWLCKALNQRATTILKVAAAVVNHQFRFLEHGVSALEPLILQEIADNIGMHASTVSRATQDKYIATPRGVYELKYLFQTGIDSNNPHVRFSAEAIRHRIKSLIQDEDKRKPISDDAISEMLEKEGITLARRTIAKYREDMHIPSSSKRKRLHLADF